MKGKFIGLDIGGTKCAVILGAPGKEGAIRVLDKMVFPTGDNPAPAQMLPQLQWGVEKLSEAHGIPPREILALGISCGGPLNSKTGTILSPPNLPGWDQVEVVQYFENRFHIPVALQNDANACALAEWKFGAGRGTRNMIFLTFGTGMGAGLILDGKLYSGTNDNAGEVGHIRLDRFGPVGYGKSGSFEGFCSGGGIAQLARLKVLEKLQMGQKVSFCESMAGLPAITARMVAEAAKSGDPVALEVFDLCGSFLGQGLSVLIDILNPECIVIGSIFCRSGSILIPSMEKTLREEALPLSRKICRIVPAALEEEIGDLASLSVAANHFQTIANT